MEKLYSDNPGLCTIIIGAITLAILITCVVDYIKSKHDKWDH